MIKKIAVIGGGSAGFLAAITLKYKLPQIQVVVIRSKDIPIIGVGEGTTVSVPNFLHGRVGVDPAEFLRLAQPTYKLGIRFLWGPRPYFNYTFSNQFNLQAKALPKCMGFYCADDIEHVNINSALMTHDKAFVRLPNGAPGIRNDVAYHIENVPFVAFLETYATRIGVQIVDDTITRVEQDESGVTGLVCASGPTETADLYLDCSGFLSLVISQTLNEPFISFKSSLFCDRAVVGGWTRGADEPIKPYTTAETMNSGWCWQIEHETRINRGYVYSSSFISDDEAEKEFRDKNPKIQSTRVVRFKSGRYERAWLKNVVAIGNSGGFVKPLESTSLAAICDESWTLAGSLMDCDFEPGPAMAAVFNKHAAASWDDIRQFLAIYYKYNTRLDSPFWRECREKTEICDAQEFVDYYFENGPSSIWRDTLIGGWDVFGFEGYLCMLVGQAVPFRRAHKPSEREMEALTEIRQTHRTQAMGALNMEQTLAVLRDPRWRYDPKFFSRFT